MARSFVSDPVAPLLPISACDLPLPCLRCTCPDAQSSGEWPVPFAGGDREEGKGRESEGRLTLISTSARINKDYH